MTCFSSPRGGAALLLLLALGLLSACTAPEPTAAPAETATAAPGTITPHLDGRAGFYMGVGGGN